MWSRGSSHHRFFYRVQPTTNPLRTAFKRLLSVLTVTRSASFPRVSIDSQKNTTSWRTSIQNMSMWKTFHIQIITLPYSYSFLVSCLANSRQSSNRVSFIRCLCLVMTQLSTLALLLLMPSGNRHKTGSQNKYCILFMGFPSMESHSPDCMILLPQNNICVCMCVQSYCSLQ